VYTPYYSETVGRLLRQVTRYLCYLCNSVVSCLCTPLTTVKQLAACSARRQGTSVIYVIQLSLACVHPLLQWNSWQLAPPGDRVPAVIYVIQLSLAWVHPLLQWNSWQLAPPGDRVRAVIYVIQLSLACVHPLLQWNSWQLAPPGDRVRAVFYVIQLSLACVHPSLRWTISGSYRSGR
jgi:hypothetical protein